MKVFQLLSYLKVFISFSSSKLSNRMLLIVLNEISSLTCIIGVALSASSKEE
jgi:hypothetical protein